MIRTFLSLVVLFAGCEEKGETPPTDTDPAAVDTVETAEPAQSVTVRLHRTDANAGRVSVGVPFAPGDVASVAELVISAEGEAIDADVTELVPFRALSADGGGVRAALVQFDASRMTSAEMDLTIAWGGSQEHGSVRVPFADAGVSHAAPEVAHTAVRTITESDGVAALVEVSREDRVVFVGQEPNVVATWPPEYLARVGFLGGLPGPDAVASADYAGVAFFADLLPRFAEGGRYVAYDVNDAGDVLDPYPVHPESVAAPEYDYEGWLYDRCATYLTNGAMTGDVDAVRAAYRACSYYAGRIGLTGDEAGIFLDKPDPDIKYSHLRGLFFYYLLTGDEQAIAAGEAIAKMWESEQTFVAPYRDGHLRGEDKLWTERLLGTSLEGLVYGYLLTGEQTYATAFSEMLDTASAHVLGDAAALHVVNPWNAFPPQDCFVHNAEQAAEGVASDPWCSGWMSELMIDPLLAWQELDDDARVDEIFVHLTRFLRDTGSMYFRGNPLGDTFLAPSVCFDPADTENPRVLFPAYGAGLDETGARVVRPEWDDFEHCADATALTAAAIRASKRLETFDLNPVGPFASEGESFVALHEEFAACARWAFAERIRPNRAPSRWSADELAEGLPDPEAFLRDQKIGWPVYDISPRRKISWWFNSSMLQVELLRSAGVTMPTAEGGSVWPCP